MEVTLHHVITFAKEDEFAQEFLDAILAATERLRATTAKLEAALKPRK